MHILLHNLRSAYNVGSIFRTADAAGVSHLWLTGYTPLPIDRFGRVKQEIAKTALGGERSVSWSAHPSFGHALKAIRKEHMQIIAVEQSATSHDYKKFKVRVPACFIFGNEVRGLSKQILAQADTVIHIPMHGHKESLNVSVAAGIILFEVQD